MRDHGREMPVEERHKSAPPGSVRAASGSAVAAAGQVLGGPGLVPEAPGSAAERVPDTATSSTGAPDPGAQPGPSRSALDAEICGELIEPYGGPALQHVQTDTQAAVVSHHNTPVRSN